MEMNRVLDERLVSINLSETSKEGVIGVLGDSLLKLNYVKESFIEAAIKREMVYPTGLPTIPYGVALPHADCIHVNKTSIAIGILSNPVEFNVMGAPDKTVPVKFVFLLAICEAEKQIEWLKGLAILFESEAALENLAKLENPTEIIKALEIELYPNLI